MFFFFPQGGPPLHLLCTMVTKYLHAGQQEAPQAATLQEEKSKWSSLWRERGGCNQHTPQQTCQQSQQCSQLGGEFWSDTSVDAWEKPSSWEEGGVLFKHVGERITVSFPHGRFSEFEGHPTDYIWISFLVPCMSNPKFRFFVRAENKPLFQEVANEHPPAQVSNQWKREGNQRVQKWWRLPVRSQRAEQCRTWQEI